MIRTGVLIWTDKSLEPLGPLSACSISFPETRQERLRSVKPSSGVCVRIPGRVSSGSFYHQLTNTLRVFLLLQFTLLTRTVYELTYQYVPTRTKRTRGIHTRWQWHAVNTGDSQVSSTGGEVSEPKIREEKNLIGVFPLIQKSFTKSYLYYNGRVISLVDSPTIRHWDIKCREIKSIKHSYGIYWLITQESKVYLTVTILYL